jgi:hypothetical protein
MILGMTCKNIGVAGLATVATDATASYGPFDISGYGHVVISALHPPATATNADVKWAGLSVLVGDTTTYANATAVSGLVGVTTSTASTSQFVLGVHNNTTYASITKLSISNNKHKFAFVNATPPATTNYRRVDILVEAFHAAQAPNSASEAGCAAIASSVSNNPGNL